MLSGLGGLGLAYLAVFALNLVPAFMPPTWSVLAFFYTRGGLPLLPLALGGAVAATAGRVALALVSRRLGGRFLGAERRAGLERLGTVLDARARVALPLGVLLYSFGPIPSNELFIVAGLTRVRLFPIAAAFLAGRMLSYTAWVAGAHAAAERLDDIFVGYWQSAGALAVQLLALAVLVLLARIDWTGFLERRGLGAAPAAR